MHVATPRDGIHVVDDFYRDPDRVAALGRSCEYSADNGANFAGRESLKSFAPEGMLAIFAAVCGKELECDPARWVFGKFRRAKPQDSGRTEVHVDEVSWTAVVYLSPADVGVRGLTIYRNVPLNLDAVPDRFPWRDAENYQDFDRKYVFPSTGRPEDWEEIANVEYRYNRLVLFRGGQLFHGVKPGWAGGERLTQNFFMWERS